MGCDIHLYREKKVDGQWVTADEWVDEYDEGYLDVPWEKRFTDRNYELFGFLAKVREEMPYSFNPRGLPFNCSAEVYNSIIRWDSDGHSHSHLYIKELKDAWTFLQSQTVTISGMKDKEEYEKLLESVNSEKETDWNLLYPYCSWVSNPDSYVEFSIEVPALVQLNSVRKLIELFDDVDGEDHRIVFWFDN